MNENPQLGECLITTEAIHTRVSELAREISHDCTAAGIERLHVIGTLIGGAIFTVDLMRELTLPVTLDFVAVSSYDGMRSTGSVAHWKRHELPLSGKHILLVDDIIDTGSTLEYLLHCMHEDVPRSLRLCCLLNKPSRRTTQVEPDYIGFNIDDHFVVGYGLDYNGWFRNHPDIHILKLS